MKLWTILFSLFVLGACTPDVAETDHRRAKAEPYVTDSKFTDDVKGQQDENDGDGYGKNESWDGDGTEPGDEDTNETDETSENGVEENAEDKGDGDYDGDEEAGDEEAGDEDGETDGDDTTDDKGESPSQNKDETADKGEDDSKEEASGPCVWFPEAGSYKGKVEGLPGGIELDIASYKDDPDVILDTDEYFIFLVRVYAKRDRKVWHSHTLKNIKGYEHKDYTVTVTNPNDASCTAEAAAKGDRRTRGGCFDPATRIRMADGSNKPVMTLKKGDLVLNPRTGKSMAITRIVDGPEKSKPMYEVRIGARMVKVTGGHPFATARGMLPATALKKGDRITGHNGKTEAIASIRKLPVNPQQMVRNFTVAGGKADQDHLILANGIVTGDLHLQQKLLNSSSPGKMAKVIKK